MSIISINIIPIAVSCTLGARQLIIFSGWPGSGKTYLMSVSAKRTSECSHVSFHEADAITQPYMKARHTRQYTPEHWRRDVNCMRTAISTLITSAKCQIVILFGLVWLGRDPVDITDHLNSDHPSLKVTKYWISVTEGTMLRNLRVQATNEHALQRDVTAAAVKDTLSHTIPPGFETLSWDSAARIVQTIVAPNPAGIFPISDVVTAVVLSYLTVEEHCVSLPLVHRQFLDLLKLPTAWPPVLSFRDFGSVGANLHKFASLRFKHANLGGDMHLTDADLQNLSRMPLQTLSLRWCSAITDAGLAHLTDFRLHHLDLGGCDITDAGLAHLAALPLEDLDLTYCASITDAGLAHLRREAGGGRQDSAEEAGGELQSLNLKSCQEITDAGLAHLANLPLHTLRLSDCNRITDDGLLRLVAMPLQTLDLRGCIAVTDDGLAHLAALPLHSLNLAHNCTITDAGLAHLVTLPLRTLNLSICRMIRDAGLALLAKLPLQTLDLGGCAITDAGLVHLAALPLQDLDLSSCMKITDAGLAHLAGLPLQQLDLSMTSVTDAALGILSNLTFRRPHGNQQLRGRLCRKYQTLHTWSCEPTKFFSKVR
jgi:hypothetical protein